MYTLNGKFICQKITGMERYAYEILKELDKISKKGEFEIVVPTKASHVPEYKNIKVVRYGNLTGIPWEQICLPAYLYKHHHKCISLLSMVPLLAPSGIVVAHGVNYKVNPQFFRTFRDKLSRLWHILNFRVYFTFAEKIITVSNFSQSEIMRVYKVKPERITVAPNAWQHMLNISAAEDTFERYPDLKKGEYYFSISSVNDNKNFKWIAQAAIRNPNCQFAIAGGRSLTAYYKRSGVTQPDNLLFLGYISDEDLKALLAHCKAFIFPTYYEGFGIPPMEAMCCGAQAIVSDTATMHEVYQNTVHYIDPNDPDVDLEKLMEEPVAPAKQTLERYSWKKSAEIFYKTVLGMKE